MALIGPMKYLTIGSNTYEIVSESTESTTWYGSCGTTASTAEKGVTCSGFTYTTGAIIGILFTTANTAATPTLNINSTGAKSIYVGTSTPNSTTNVLQWSANTMIYVIADGTNYRYITSAAAGSVLQPRGANTWYGTCSVGATTAAKTSAITNYVLTQGAIVVITCSTANTADAPTLNINSTGAKAIYYNNAVTSSSNKLTWDANETLTFVYSGSYYYFICKSKLITKVSELTNDKGFITGGSNANSAVVISPITTSITPITSAGSVTAGTANTPTVIDITKFSGGSFTRGTFSGGAFTQGSDSFTANTPTVIDTTKFSGGSFTQGTDSFTANTPTVINTSKFSGGSFTRGAFSGGSFTQGTDSFTAASLQSGFYTAGSATTPATIDTTKFSGGSFTQGAFTQGSFTQGTDSFTANTPTIINTSKFSGGSYSHTGFNGGSFTQGSDSFTAASLNTGFYTAGSATTPAIIDTTKFNGGSYSHTGFNGGSFTRGAFNSGYLSMSMDTTDNKKLNITFSAATHANDSFTSATYGTDTFTSASFSTGFYTAGTKGSPTTIDVTKFSGGSFTQGSDSFTSATYGTDSFTAASLQSGFYTAGTAASFTQGTDTFVKPTHASDTFTSAKFNTGFYTAGTKGTPTTIDVTKFNGGSFTQGSDSFTAATHAADSFTTASLQSGFYTAGTSASFTQGSDIFTSAKFNTGFYTAGTAASFTQGADTFVSATHAADSFTSAKLNSGFYTAGTANVPTAVTLPTVGSAVSVWTGYNSGVANTYAEAQTFTGSTS